MSRPLAVPAILGPLDHLAERSALPGPAGHGKYLAYWRLAMSAAAHLTAPAGPPDPAGRLRLSRAATFRDLGGYDTDDGRRVRSGTLFRSDNLASLSARDLATFRALGLKTLYDLRHDYEREIRPSRLRAGSEPQVVEIPIYYPPLDRRESRRKILEADVEPGHFRQLMLAANRAYALDFREEWSALLRALAEPGALPAVIHFVEGKDRTGFAAALALSAVGVPRETVYQDYLLSGVFLRRRAKIYAFLASLGSRFRVSRAEVRPLLDVERVYLESAFAAIDERFGSFGAYLGEGLGIDPSSLARLRDSLTE